MGKKEEEKEQTVEAELQIQFIERSCNKELNSLNFSFLNFCQYVTFERY